MTSRYPSGQLVSVAPTLDPARGNAADGIYTLSQYTQAVQDGVWPGYDPYFRQTVLLLHGNGADGAQNNTFLDSSPNNFTITRAGNTTQGAFSPFSLPNGAWSNYITSTTQWLSIANNTALDLPGDFTIEAWVFCDSTANRSHQIVGKWGTSAYAWVIGVNPSTGVFYIAYGNSGSYVGDAGFGTVFVANQWVHVAVTRSGSTVRGFVNGVQQGSNQTITSNLSATATTFIGRDDTTTRNFSGYVSNVRVVKGTAVYTSNFTPSTAPLAAITNTSLLTCQSNRFVDNSTNAFAITRTGDVRVTPFSPFRPSAAYSAGTNGGSGYFDGTGDYLTIPSSTAFAFGTGDFTMEAWIYSLSTATQRIISMTGNIEEFLVVNNSGLELYYYDGTTNFTSGANKVPLASWNHVAVSRSSGTIRLFINGVLVNTPATSSSNRTTALAAYIGIYQNGSLEPFLGYISNARVVKGTAVYTAPFTPPNAPLTAITNTSLLTNFTNAGIIDSTARMNLETVGNAQIDTAIRKFGSGSLEFDGSGDCLRAPTNPLLVFGSADFTIEAWVYQTQRNTLSDIVGCHNYGVGADWLFSINSSGNLFFQISSSGTGAQTSAGTVPLQNWCHVAVVRASGVVSQYINGIQVSTASYTTSVGNTIPLAVGASNNLNAASTFYGYIDELRITSGQARYTSNFSVTSAPRSALPISGGSWINNTVLMLPGTGVNGAQNNTFQDSSASNLAITRNGNTTQGSYSPFSRINGAWSNYFDGSGDYLTVPTVGTSLSQNDFTIESWIYVLDISAVRALCGGLSSNYLSGFEIDINTNGSITFFAKTNNVSQILLSTAANTISINRWLHVAVVKSSTTYTIYVNGQSAASTVTANTWSDQTFISIGILNGSPLLYPWLGYISNFRVVKGTAVYTSNFTPSTAPLVAINNTALLTCQSNRFIDNSVNNYVITSVGDTRILSFSPFAYNQASWSNYFDGSGDAVTTPKTSALAPAGDFTIEAWIYPQSLPVGQIAGIHEAGTTADWVLGVSALGEIAMYIPNANIFASYLSTQTINRNQWSHIVASRTGSTLYLGCNGQLTSHSVSASLNYGTSGIPFSIGADQNGDESNFTGWISNFRMVSGTGLYAGATYSVPTAPLTAVPNTAILTCQGLNFRDAGPSNLTLTVLGNTAINSFSPFEFRRSYSAALMGGAGYFDGNGDFLDVPTGTSASIFGTGDFTIEFWVYNMAGTSTSWNPIMTMGASGGGREIRISQNINGTGYGFLIPNNSNNGDRFFGFGTLPLNQWHHFALVRNGANVRFYRNGTDIGGVTDASFNYTNTGPTRIGYGFYPSDGFFTGGYISDVRLIKGTAIYTANFVPPQSPATAITNTTLLCSFVNAGFVDESMTSAIETVNQAQISSAQSVWGGGSLYFDGTGDYLRLPSSLALGVGTGDFTIEVWARFDAAQTAAHITDGTVNSALFLKTTATTVGLGRTNIAEDTMFTYAFEQYTWYHILFSRLGGTVYGFVNGALIGRAANTINYTENTGLTIGADTTGSQALRGYLQDLRIIKGQATIPVAGQTSQWQDQ